MWKGKKEREEKPEIKKKRKKKKAGEGGRGCGIWTDLLRHTQWNRTKISGVLFMQQGRKICAHSSAECVAISA
jgi:hypothetical protein